jgi:hypothetical protein
MTTPWFDLATEAVEATLDETRKPEPNVARLMALYAATILAMSGLMENAEAEMSTANSVLDADLREIRHSAERRLGQLLAGIEQ